MKFFHEDDSYHFFMPSFLHSMCFWVAAMGGLKLRLDKEYIVCALDENLKK